MLRTNKQTDGLERTTHAIFGVGNENVRYEISHRILIIHFLGHMHERAEDKVDHTPVADPEFHNGGRTVEGEGSGFEFLPENGGFWCILGLLFTCMQKLVRSMAGRPPLDPPLPYTRSCACADDMHQLQLSTSWADKIKAIIFAGELSKGQAGAGTP